MKLVLPTLLLGSLLATSLHAGEATNPAEVDTQTDIQKLVTRFKEAILAKDGESMHALFLPGGSWLQGLDKHSLAKVRAKKPDARQFGAGNYEQFAKFVGSSPKAIEETFDNVRIESDGTVGTVYFDYQFLQEGKPLNHGVETWQIVHTDDGWKISAMLYSVILDDIH
jgi:hypothetical protein